jgi:hypothetical protein
LRAVHRTAEWRTAAVLSPLSTKSLARQTNSSTDSSAWRINPAVVGYADRALRSRPSALLWSGVILPPRSAGEDMHLRARRRRHHRPRGVSWPPPYPLFHPHPARYLSRLRWWHVTAPHRVNGHAGIAGWKFLLRYRRTLRLILRALGRGSPLVACDWRLPTPDEEQPARVPARPARLDRKNSGAAARWASRVPMLRFPR